MSDTLQINTSNPVEEHYNQKNKRKEGTNNLIKRVSAALMTAIFAIVLGALFLKFGDPSASFNKIIGGSLLTGGGITLLVLFGLYVRDVRKNVREGKERKEKQKV